MKIEVTYYYGWFDKDGVYFPHRTTWDGGKPPVFGETLSSARTRGSVRHWTHPNWSKRVHVPAKRATDTSA